jgi:hypothetical protein
MGSFEDSGLLVRQSASAADASKIEANLESQKCFLSIVAVLVPGNKYNSEVLVHHDPSSEHVARLGQRSRRSRSREGLPRTEQGVFRRYSRP